MEVNLWIFLSENRDLHQRQILFKSFRPLTPVSKSRTKIYAFNLFPFILFFLLPSASLEWPDWGLKSVHPSSKYMSKSYPDCANWFKLSFSFLFQISFKRPPVHRTSVPLGPVGSLLKQKVIKALGIGLGRPSTTTSTTTKPKSSWASRAKTKKTGRVLPNPNPDWCWPKTCRRIQNRLNRR